MIFHDFQKDILTLCAIFGTNKCHIMYLTNDQKQYLFFKKVDYLRNKTFELFKFEKCFLFWL
jgi:hypothetical protein